MANIPNIQKALYPHIPKIAPSIPYPFKFLANIPVYLKNLPGPQNFRREILCNDYAALSICYRSYIAIIKELSGNERRETQYLIPL